MKTRFLFGVLVLALCTQMSIAADVDWSNQMVSVKDYGADGSDSSDDSTAFTSAINYCKNNGYKTLFIPNGTYYISSALPVLNNNGFSCVNIMGENTNLTVLDGSSLSASTPILQTSGGSGRLANAQIKGVTFKGSYIQTGVRLKGTCGVKIVQCHFESLNNAIIFSNDIGNGTFTEYSVADSCNFTDNNTALYYYRGNGDASFHGSGLRHCTISHRSGASTPVIRIGASSKPTLHLYNAPLDFQLWTRDSIAVIDAQVSAGSKMITHGTITLELFDSAQPTLAQGDVNVMHAGHVTCWSSPIHFGKLNF